ncbi:MAG: ATP-binding cassette family protein [Cyanobacteria bacterium QS_8_64_29]|nr:MAG: ATP-binding cassette family protein [Cyanobacteria bacterium QS_8_64_29]
MIPLQLTLRNFLSYREASLDFRGFKTACICGPNGAGKSSLLEAITWVLWGQTRATAEDDVIHAGATEARVDFTFATDGQTYRAIRSRRRGQSSALELQVQTESGEFRSISERGVRATQRQIVSLLKLDYDTFINSAYLRQGRADEFMLRRPSERKQILAELLKLDRYETLAEQANDRAKQYKGQAEQLAQQLSALEQQLQQAESLAQEREQLESQIEALRAAQASDRQERERLQALDNQRQTLQQQLAWQQQQYQTLAQDCDRLVQDRDAVQAQLDELQQLLERETEIAAGYETYQRLQREEQALASQFQQYQEAQQQRQALQQQQTEQINAQTQQLQQIQAQLDSLEQQESELQRILGRADKIARGLEQLQHHRQRLQQLDERQQQASPLLERRDTLSPEIERERAQLEARCNQLKSQQAQLDEQLAQAPQLRSRLQAIEAEIALLQSKQTYRQRVQEKGQERKTFQERLQETQRRYQEQLSALSQQLEQLQANNAVCPLCERPLDEAHKQHVVQKTETEQQQLQEQFWVLREQLAACERELQVLRSEYHQLSEALDPYESRLQQRGELSAQLAHAGDHEQQRQAIADEIAQLERSLAQGDYAPELQAEYQQVEAQRQELGYDEQTHALAREEVERWRWAEIEQAKLEDARQRQAHLASQKPQLQQQHQQCQQQIEHLRADSELQQQIEALDRQLAELGYEHSHHNQVLTQLQQARAWETRYQELQRARQQAPELAQRQQELEQRRQARAAERERAQQQLETLQTQLAQTQDCRADIEHCEEQIQQRQQQLDDLLAQQGRLEQRSAQLEQVRAQYEQAQQQQQTAQRQQRIYRELAQAFGKNGIQTLMIENVLPQLETQTNQILSQLTGNQLHVQFVTQKASKGRSKKQSKSIDTLEIRIADPQGTRAYETYSGGEGFRINFAIRLALARILAQRAGTSLQMLIVDEGFGTQDDQGCERLIAAIGAIAPEFSCILAVTHMPQFKEAFAHRIEVRKTQQGSALSVAA